MDAAETLLRALQQGSLAMAMRDSVWLYPVVETVHIFGFSILVGAVVLFDLRVLGVSKRISVRLLARHLLPWSLAALLLVVPAGGLMFVSAADELVANPAFRTKMGLLLLALANAAAFHAGALRNAGQWDQDAPAPIAARLHALASILIWAGVVTCGRMIAYV